MKLNKRLEAIYNLIDDDAIVADIGCDHALLACSLVLNRKCNKVYACDVNPRPLKGAMATIKGFNLDNYIIGILSDGLDKVPDDADTYVIAGMGYDTVAGILLKGKKKLTSNKKIIVQINKDVFKLRKFIDENNCCIIKEKCVFDNNHFYEIVEFQPMKDKQLSYKEIYLGKKMIKDNIYYSYLKKRLKDNKVILSNIQRDNKNYKHFMNLTKLIDDEIKSV